MTGRFLSTASSSSSSQMRSIRYLPHRDPMTPSQNTQGGYVPCRVFSRHHTLNLVLSLQESTDSRWETSSSCEHGKDPARSAFDDGTAGSGRRCDSQDTFFQHGTRKATAQPTTRFVNLVDGRSHQEKNVGSSWEGRARDPGGTGENLVARKPR